MRARLLALALPIALVTACGGDDGGASPDAADLDAAVPDAEVPDADPSGPVTITVTGEGSPIPDVDVVFNDATGAVLSHKTTGSDGKATETMLPGGSLTIAVQPPSGYFTVTYSDVQPGDDLVWQFDAPVPATVGDLAVTLPGVQANATRYDVQIGCRTFTTNNPALPVTGTITADCLGSDDKIDVVAIAYAANGSPVGYDYQTAVTAVSGGTTVVTLDAWQVTSDPLTVTLTNAPGNTAAAGLEGHFRIDGLDFVGVGGGATPVAGTITIPSAYLSGGIAQQLQYLIFIQLGTQQAPAGFHAILAGHAGTPATVTHDLSQLLPSMSAATATTDAGRPSLGWIASGSFAAADGALVLASWHEGADLHQSFALLPPDASNPTVFPAMPDELAAYRPTGSSAWDLPTVIFIDADYIDGWDDFRTGPGFALLGDNALDQIPATGGVMRASIGGNLPGN